MPTVLHRLSQWAKEEPNSAAQKFKSKSGEWKTITGREFYERVYYLALFFESRGITAQEAGAILAYNSPEWVHTDLALLLMGAKSAGLYPNSTAKDIQYILNHTEATMVAVQNADYFKKLLGEKNEFSLPDRVKLLLVFEGDTSMSPKAVSYDTALAEGRKIAASGGKKFDDFLKKLDPKAGAFLIYTSGTTGNPKGALLSHENLMFTSDLAIDYWKLKKGVAGTMFSFLPLCHIAEKLQNVGVGTSLRYCVSYATKFENVSSELPEVQPTVLLSVPRLWEKMMEGVQYKIRTGKGAKKHLAEWALAVGARVADAKFNGRSPNPLDLLQLKLADKLVLSKVRQAMGLSQKPRLASGAAPLPAHVSKWFRCLDLEILEDYGQTESTGVICMTEEQKECSGTVGKPVPGTEFKLAEDGEILTKGRHVFVEYYKDPAATASTLIDGWLHTGDLGEWTPDGMIKIRGRKKEIMKTSGGKMVAPLPIEERLKASDIISQVCMVGDNRKYFSALITLTEPVLNGLKSSGAATKGVVLADPEIVAQVKKIVEELNSELASYEQIKRFTVLAREFSVVDGEMTPTLKMKRNVIESSFREVIDSMYS